MNRVISWVLGFSPFCVMFNWTGVYGNLMIGYELKVDMTGANGIAKNWYLYLVKNTIFIIWNFK